MVCFYFFESRKFSPKGLGLGFLTRISASRRVSDFTIRHPSYKEKRLYLVFAGYFWCKLYNSRLLWLRGGVGGQFPRNVLSLFWEEPWPDFSSTGKWRLLFLNKRPRDPMSENNCRGQWRCNSTGHKSTTLKGSPDFAAGTARAFHKLFGNFLHSE